MAIQQRIFQVAQMSEMHRALAGVCIDVSGVERGDVNQMMLAVAAARDPGVVTFPHTFDPQKATAWLAQCFRPEAEIAAMHPQNQAIVVNRAWVALGRYFQALNVRPYALRAFRRICAMAWGGPPAGPSDESSARTLVRGQRPWMTWDWPGSWREEAARRYVGGRRDQRSVIFGSQNENDDAGIDEAVGCSTANTAINANCPMPAESHRVWLQNNGSVTGLLWTPFECADGGVLDSDNTDMDGTDDPTGDDPSRQGFWNWNCGAWEDSDPAIGRTRLFVIAPLIWYWRLICAPVTGLKVTEDGPDVSLVEWLWRLGPAEVIRTIKRDVVLKNALMLAARGRERLSQILGDAEVTEGQMHEAEVGDFRQIGNVILGSAGSVVALGGPVGIIGGAVLGLAGAVMTFFPTVFVGGETITIDLFGRRMTVVEIFAQQEMGAGAISYLEAIQMPEPTGAIGVLTTNDRRLPGPPPPMPGSPRPSPLVVVVPVSFIEPGPDLPPPPPRDGVVLRGSPSGSSVGSVIAVAAAAIAVGATAQHLLSKRSRDKSKAR